MINIGDLLGEKADRIIQESIKIGDVHYLNLDKGNGITPKKGDDSRNKFFIVLGFDNEGNVIGGVVINSNINPNLPSYITDYLLPVKVEQFPFLKYDSFVNCSNIIVAQKTKFTAHTYRGTVSNIGILQTIISTVQESPTVNRKQLKNFGII